MADPQRRRRRRCRCCCCLTRVNERRCYCFCKYTSTQNQDYVDFRLWSQTAHRADPTPQTAQSANIRKSGRNVNFSSREANPLEAGRGFRNAFDKQSRAERARTRKYLPFSALPGSESSFLRAGTAEQHANIVSTRDFALILSPRTIMTINDDVDSENGERRQLRNQRKAWLPTSRDEQRNPEARKKERGERERERERERKKDCLDFVGTSRR